MIEVKETKDHQLLAALNEEVQQLHHDIHPQIFKPFDKVSVAEAFESFIVDDTCRAFVAWLGDEPVGYIITFLKESGDNAFHFNVRSLYIDQLGVPERHRRLGVGQLLLARAEALALELPVTRLDLDHWTANTVAAAWFRKHGYQLCREKLWKFI